MWVYIFCSIKTPCSSWFTFQICLMPPRPSSPTIPVHSMVIFLGLWLLSTAGKFLLDIGGLLAHMTPPSVLLGHNAFYTNLFAWLILTFSCFSLTRKTWEEEKKKKCGKCLRVHFQEQRVERGGDREGFFWLQMSLQWVHKAKWRKRRTLELQAFDKM